MKKSLLLLSVAAFAGMANAQVVVGLATSEELEKAGLGKDKVTMEAKTILENEAGSFGLAYEDSWGTTTTYKNYQNVTVNGEAITLGSGAVGNANPTFVSYEEGVMSAGAVFKIEANKDGYMTVFTKINPNKQYLVFEGKTGALPFTLGYSNGSETIHYTLPVQTTGNDAGYIDFAASDASKYFIVAQKQSTNEAGQPLWKDKDGNIVAGDRPVWTGDDGKEKKGAAVMEDIPGQNKPQFPYLVAGLEKAPGESTGFLTFNVIKGNIYYFSALGSKAACGGFVYTENDPKIVFPAQDVTDKDGNVTSFPEVVFNPLMDPSAVEAVEAVDNADAPVYNMMGIRVNSDAKGILIQNGKKFIRK